MKINDIVEQGGVGRITAQNRTKDVGPNEIAKQAKKFGNKVSKDGYPPLLRESAVIEASTLSPAEIYKRPGRAETMLNKIKSESPFTLSDGTAFVVDPKAFKLAKDFFAAKKSGALVLPEKGTDRKVSTATFVKTAEFGGQQRGFDQTDAGGKESYQIKPSQIFKDEVFTASNIGDEIINNPMLQQSDIGKHIINAAQEILAGRNPDLTNIPPAFINSIRDYAGEYLGVIAMLKGLADFPGQEGFFKHLAVTDLRQLKLYFPKASNNPLGDSIGSFTNPMTDHQIIISSKGGKQGAPPSLDNLKIPDELTKSRSLRNEIKFIKTAQQSKAVMQPFLLANILADIAPQSLPKALLKILPMPEQNINKIIALMDAKQYSKKDISKLGKGLLSFVTTTVNLDRVNDNSTPGGLVHYAINKMVIDAVNKNNALPNFEPLAREILQKNFIQIFTRIAQNKMVWSIVWPNKQMGTGKISLYSKASSTEPAKQKLSFSVHD